MFLDFAKKIARLLLSKGIVQRKLIPDLGTDDVAQHISRLLPHSFGNQVVLHKRTSILQVFVAAWDRIAAYVAAEIGCINDVANIRKRAAGSDGT